MNFNFPYPTGEEIKVVQELAKFSPEMLDGREMWILQNFLGGDYNVPFTGNEL